MFTWPELHELYALSSPPVELPLRYNVTPGQLIPTIRQDEDGRQLAPLHWGLIPFWAKDKKIGYRMSNARGETVADKPSFRNAFRRRRCIIPASGFYEWQAQPQSKQPFYIHPADNHPWSFGGLWERWQGEGDETVESCSIITTEANELMAPIHERMPVILDRNQVGLWLDDNTEPDELLAMLKPYSVEQMRAYPVSTYVNKASNSDRHCIDPL